nr:unnamed protein product [Callosobruchus analis]
MKRHLNTYRIPGDAVDMDLDIDGSLHGTTVTESARCASVDRFSHDSAHTHNDDRALDNTAPNNTRDDGDDPTTAKPGSYRLHKAVCTRWEHILTNGVGNENLLELHARHCHQRFQNQIIRGLSALGKGMNMLLERSADAAPSAQTRCYPTWWMLVIFSPIYFMTFRSLDGN